jgi:hypothetical protein
VLISQATAQGMLGLKTGDVVRVEIGDRSVTGPVYVQPGHADDAITISLGYGRKGHRGHRPRRLQRRGAAGQRGAPGSCAGCS